MVLSLSKKLLTISIKKLIKFSEHLCPSVLASGLLADDTVEPPQSIHHSFIFEANLESYYTLKTTPSE